MNSLLGWYGQLMELSKINPILSGIIGAWLATVVTLLCRNVPSRIWRFLKTQSIRSITMNNIERTGLNDDFVAFMYWFNATDMWKWTREWHRTEVRKQGGGYDRITIPGYSTHYFIWKGRLCWFSKVMQASEGVEFQKETLTIHILFATQKMLDSLVEDFKFTPKPAREKRNSIAHFWNAESFAKGSWEPICTLPPRDLKTVATPIGFKENILDRIEQFKVSKVEYERLGNPWKLSIELSGPPGTGKTSLIRAIATTLFVDIYIIHWELFSDISLPYALSKIPPGGIVLLEDYESNRNLWSIDYSKLVYQNDYEKIGRATTTAMPTLSGVLNAFDGIIQLDGVIVFWTTNHAERVDPSVRRDGRMDHKLILDELDDKDIKQYITGLAPSTIIDPDIIYHPIRGSALSKILIDNDYQLDRFVEHIPHTWQQVITPSKNKELNPWAVSVW